MPLALILSRVKTVLALGFLTAIAACGPISGQPAGGGGGVTEDGRVYALIEGADAATRLGQAARDLGYSPEPGMRLSGLGLWMVPIDLPSAVTGSEAIQALELSVPGATVGVNHAYRLQITGSAQRSNLNFANSLIAWPEQACAARHRVGLIDGPVGALGPSLGDLTLRQESFVQDANAQAARHGSDVAAILADPTRLRGLELFSANVVGSDSTGAPIAGAAQMVQAIDWLAAADVSVVSVSLAGPYNKLLEVAVRSAVAQDMVIVAAVGNLGPRAAPQYPAAFDGVVAVTAIDARERIFRNAVRGPHVDLAAAGVDVFVSAGDEGRFVSGTSVAAPLVAASLAAQNSADPDALFSDARDLGVGGKDPVFGHGLLQASRVCGGN